MPFQWAFKPPRKKILSLQEGRVPFDLIFAKRSSLAKLSLWKIVQNKKQCIQILSLKDMFFCSFPWIFKVAFREKERKPKRIRKKM